MSPGRNVDVIRVMLADDQPSIQRELQEELAPHPQVRVQAVVGSFQEVMEKLSIEVPDVLVLDLGGMGNAPISFILRLRRDYPHLNIVIYSSTLSLIPEMLNAGVLGYVAKEDLDVLITAIFLAHEGKPFLSLTAEEYLKRSQGMKRSISFSPEQMTVLKYVSQGHSTSIIAAMMGIDERTVVLLMSQVKHQTGSVTRQELIEWYRSKDR